MPSDRPDGANGAEHPGFEGRRRSIGEILDETRWDRRPDDDLLSPLASVDRYFREFPWDGLEVAEDGPAAPGEDDPSVQQSREPWPDEPATRHNR